MAESVGIKGKFDVTQFNTGLRKYLDGLSSAVTATNAAAVAMRNLGSVTNTTLSQMNSQLSGFGPSAKKGFGGITTALNKLNQGLAQANSAAQKTSSSFRELNTRSIAVGVALGQTAVNALSAIGRSFASITSQGLEMVVFFERLSLSLNFFAARSLQASNDSISFSDALAQTSQEAQGLLIWVRQLAITSPLTTQQVGTIFRVSQAYGLLAEEAQVLLPLLLDLGAATGLDPQTLELSARALGQIRARGKLTGEEIRQLGNAGIPIRDILVKQLDITNAEFDDLLESGAFVSDITIPAVTEALKDFEGAAEIVAFETIGGLLSQLQEIKQIGLADFFSGLLGAIKPLTRELVDFASNPEFLVSLKLLGEEIGTLISGGIERLTSAISGTIDAWRSLNPEVQRFIIVFLGAGAAITLIVGAMGLLFFAVQALISPFTLIVGVLAASIAAWVQWGEEITAIVQGTVRSVARAIEGLTNFFGDVVDVFFGGGNINQDLEDFGEGAGESWSTGFAVGSLRGASNAINSLFGFLSGELATASPPKFYPDIRMHGWGLGIEYTGGIKDGVKDSGVTEFMRQNLMEGLAPNNALARKIGAEDAGAYFGAWELPSQTELKDFIKPAIQELGAEGGEVQKAAFEAGVSTSQAWVDGFRTLIPIPGEIINEEIAEIIAKIGGGRQLSRSGAEAFGSFLEGFEQADFGILDDIAGQVGDFLSALVDIGDLPEIEVPRAMFRLREATAAAINEFRELGRISEDTFGKVRDAAAPVGQEIEELLRLYQDYAISTNELTEAQEELNAVTEKYEDLLSPLLKQLREVSEERQTAEEARELAELQRIVNSKIVTDERKRIAAAKIQEILTQQQIRNLEAQRDEEQGIAEEKVEGAKEAQTEAEKALEIFKAQVQAQADQLKLVADEAKQIDKLQEQLDKLREKELSVLERQLKFVGLVQQETSDSLKAAKAKIALEDATASEYEKQQAALELQEIALNRINREKQAQELGFDPNVLKQYRDLAFTMDDLGIKDKGGGGLGEGLGLDTSTLPNVKGFQKELDEVTANVKAKFEEIKQSILAFLQEVNAQLPPFLQFLRTKEGDVPLINTLKKVAVGVIIIGAALKFLDIAAKLVVVLPLLSKLVNVLGLLATALGITGLFSALVGAITALAVPIALVLSALIVFSIAWQNNWLNMREAVFRAVIGIKEDIVSIVPFLTNLKDTIIDTFTKPFSSEGREQIRQEWATLRAQITSPEGRQEILDAFRKEGQDYTSNIIAGFTQTGQLVPGVLLGTLRQTRDEVLGDPVLSDIGTITVQTITDSFTSQEDVFSNAIANSLTISGELSEQINANAQGAGSNFMDGLALGITDSTPGLEESVTTSLDQLFGLYDTELEAQSPSERSAREVGVPIAEGIAKGIGSVDQTTAVKTAVDTILAKFDDLRIQGATKFDSLRTTLVAKQKALQTSLVTATGETNTAVLAKFQELIEDVNANFAELFADLLQGWIDLGDNSVLEIQGAVTDITEEFQSIYDGIFLGAKGLTQLKTDVVALFTTMNTDVGVEAGTVRDTIVGIFISDPDSIVNQLNNSLLGNAGGGAPSPTSPTYGIGESIMLGIAAGITGNELVVANSLRSSIAFAFTSAADAIDADSPSVVAATELGLPVSQGVAAGILAGSDLIGGALQAVIQNGIGASINNVIGSTSSAATPSYVSNINRTTNFNLNVNSAVPSSGIISDFAILKSMAIG